jgi:hypothetical protein
MKSFFGVLVCFFSISSLASIYGDKKFEIPFEVFRLKCKDAVMYCDMDVYQPTKHTAKIEIKGAPQTASGGDYTETVYIDDQAFRIKIYVVETSPYTLGAQVWNPKDEMAMLSVEWIKDPLKTNRAGVTTSKIYRGDWNYRVTVKFPGNGNQ